MITKYLTDAIKGVNRSTRTVDAWISRETVDRDSEVLLADGVDLTNYRRNPVVLFAHDPKLVIGKSVDIGVLPGEGVTAVTEFATTPLAAETFDLYDGGFMKAFSVGFNTLEHGEPVREGQTGRTIRRWEMWEHSAVAIPANPDALAKAAEQGSDLAGLLLRHYCPEAKDANEAARVAADVRRLAGAAESIRNFWRHDHDAIDRKAVAAAVASLEELLQVKFMPEPDPATTPQPEPDPAVGAQSDDAAIVTALADLAAEIRHAKAQTQEAIAAAITRERRKRIGR